MRLKILFLVFVLVHRPLFAQPLDDIFRTFSVCDATFFKAIKSQEMDLKKITPIASQNDIAWFKVPNRKEDSGNFLALSGLTIANFPVLSFKDEMSDLDKFGSYYYWGFVVEGDYKDIVKKIKPLVSQNDRLVEDRADNLKLMVRGEIKTGNGQWQPTQLKNGVPKELTVERVFMIEPDAETNTVYLSCSLQGTVDADVLKDLRPDIDTKDYFQNTRTSN